MWQHWLTSYPELNLVDLDIGRGQAERRTLLSPNPLTRLLLPYDEQVLVNCLQLLVDGDPEGMGALAISESRKGSLLADIHLLAGAALLAEARFADAAAALRDCYGEERNPGEAIRRLCPSLRFELRLSPCLLVPLYPNQFSAALLFAVAQWRGGHSGEALETVREMVSQWGLYDEIKLLAGQIHLERGELDRAQHALTAGADTKHDALELDRNFYLAYVHFLKGEYRHAVRALMPALAMVGQANPHLLARARLLAAECFARCDLPLEALRQSAHVLPEEVPGTVAAEMLSREAGWVAQVQQLSHAEIERMSRANVYQLYIPDYTGAAGVSALLETSRDPAQHLRHQERSWIRMQKEKQQFAEYQARVALGQASAPPAESPLSGGGIEFKVRVARALAWWPGRHAALAQAGPRDALARGMADTAHLRYDFQGLQARSTLMLAGEKRAALVLSIGGAAALIALGLLVIRSCMY